ncbi:hypothetical protein LCGC14_2263740, partial [marine sediment metagenome]
MTYTTPAITAFGLALGAMTTGA